MEMERNLISPHGQVYTMRNRLGRRDEHTQADGGSRGHAWIARRCGLIEIELRAADGVKKVRQFVGQIIMVRKQIREASKYLWKTRKQTSSIPTETNEGLKDD